MMFLMCSNLTTFNSDLSSLMIADNMFTYCNLASDSIINIANTIKDVNNLDGVFDPMTGDYRTEFPIDLGTIPSGSDVSSALE